MRMRNTSLLFWLVSGLFFGHAGISALAASPKVFAEKVALPGGIDAEFFPELLGWLNTLSGNRGALLPIVPHLDSIAISAENCAQDEALDIQLAKRSPGCASINSLARSLGSHPSVCAKIRDPLLVANDWAYSRPAEAEARTLEGAIKLIVVPMNSVQHFSEMRSVSIVERVRSLLFKLHLDPWIARVQERLSALQRFGGQDCEAGIDRNSLSAGISALQESASALTLARSRFLAQAKLDHERVLAAGKKRSALAYPLLSDEDRELFAMIWGAVMWRIRGGGIYEKVDGTNFLRRNYAGYGFQTLVNFLSGHQAPQDIGSSFDFRLRLRGWSGIRDIGRRGGDRFGDWNAMKERGLFQVGYAQSAFARWGYSVEPLTLAGEHFGHCYAFTWEHMGGIEWGKGLHSPFDGFATSPSSWGEVCVGAALGLGLAKTILPGRSSR